MFFWDILERQIRIDGKIEKLSKEESEEYFHIRPIESQIGAHASKQSSEIESREYLEKKFAELMEKYKDKTIPMPEFWGGYLLIPEIFEYWQGRPGRLHDRIVYEKTENKWKMKRLSP